jgi:hypothetical protein
MTGRGGLEIAAAPEVVRGRPLAMPLSAPFCNDGGLHQRRLFARRPEGLLCLPGVFEFFHHWAEDPRGVEYFDPDHRAVFIQFNIKARRQLNKLFFGPFFGNEIEDIGIFIVVNL